SIRVFAYDPAIVGTQIEQSLARFDVVWQTSVLYDRFDHGASIEGVSIFPPGLNNPISNTINNFFAGIFSALGHVDPGEFRTELIKPLPTGGLAGITFHTDYFAVPRTFELGLPFNVPGAPPSATLPVPFVFTPAWRPALDFTFEQ